MLKKMIFSALVCSVLFASSAQAAAAGDWTETFQLKGGLTVEHTPDRVNFNNTISAKEVHIHSKLFSGIPLSHCGFFGSDGLDLKANSTRSEFVKELKCSGLYSE